jgi:hypothetical protein
MQVCAATSAARDAPERLEATLRSGRQVFVAGVSVNCAARLKIVVERPASAPTSIAIGEDWKPGEAIARCICRRQIEVTLHRSVGEGSAVHLVRRGVVTAQAIAPYRTRMNRTVVALSRRVPACAIRASQARWSD